MEAFDLAKVFPMDEITIVPHLQLEDGLQYDMENSWKNISVTVMRPEQLKKMSHTYYAYNCFENHGNGTITPDSDRINQSGVLLSSFAWNVALSTDLK